MQLIDDDDSWSWRLTIIITDKSSVNDGKGFIKSINQRMELWIICCKPTDLKVHQLD